MRLNRKLLPLLAFLCCICVNSANATKSVDAAAFAESVATLRVEAIKNAESKTTTSTYKVESGKAPVKVALNLKKGEQYIILSSASESTSSDSRWIMNDAVFTDANGKTANLANNNSKIMGDVKFKFVKNNVLITCNGTKLQNAVQFPLAATLFIEADSDKTLEFELMLNADSGANATVKVIKVVNAAKIAALEDKFPTESRLYTSFAKGVLPILIYKQNNSVDKSVANTAIKKLSNSAEMQAELDKAAAMPLSKQSIAKIIELFVTAREIIDIQAQMEWMKISAVEQTLARLKQIKGYNAKAAETMVAELKSLVSNGFEGMYSVKTSASSIENAKRALELQKQIILSNPAFDFDKILVGRYDLALGGRTANASHMGTQPNNWSNQTSAKQNGFNAEIGIFSNLRSENMEYETIYKPEWDTSLPDIRLNWDANRVLFSMNPKDDHHWQVYEYNIDKKKVEQITFGSEEHIDYFDAAYLPSGDLAVISNVGGQGVPCVHGTDQVGNLCLFNPETKDMRRLTFDQDANWGPVMMQNGKLMYQRWEYTDLMHYYSRFVMSMNPDGTEQRALFGSGMTFPNTTFDVQPLPDHASRFVGIVSGHHGVVRAGRLFMYDPAISRNTTDAMIHEFPFKGRELEVIVKDRLVDGVFPQFIKPFPIDNETMLVTAKLNPESLWGVYLVDTEDNLVLLQEFEGEGLIHATPVITSKVPPVIPDRIDLSKKEATVFIQDIYEGEGLPNVPRGTVKELRLLTYEYAYINSPSNHYAQGIQAGWDIKTNLGTVPVEEDGSVIFKIPANTPVAIQPLDSEGRAIQWMRSWFVGMPGENISCVGCHEDQNIIPLPKKTIASARAPHALKTPVGGIRPYTFDLEMQPILDRTCVSCHGEGKKLDFTGYIKDANGYGTSALALHPYVHRQGAEAAMKVMVPYEYHASVSPLVQMLKNGHYGVELTEDEWKTLYNWIDFNVQEKGSFETLKYHGYDQYDRRIELNKKYANGIYSDWRQQTKDYAAYLESQPKAEAIKPAYTAPKFKDVKFKSSETPKATGETKVVEVAPGVKITFVKIPAGEFAMGENKVNSNAAPAHRATVDKAFWMSTTELTNGQIRALLPEHNSRYYDQQWKDHVVEGYPANGDDQVAIRISWNSANEYCAKLSMKTGLKINLPTETQWEWAARGGSKSDYWYGQANTNFAKKENLSDKQMLKMAVMRVDPQPMTPGNDLWGGIHWYDYCTYIPKDESVDDGYMLPAPGGSFEANQFGLHDMLGNVSEWTRSDYFRYDEKIAKGAKSEYKVVKGGAWNTHPKDARVATRKYFYPWQAPYNVGVRLVIEE